MLYSIPIEIILQSDCMTSTGSSEDSGTMSHCREAIDVAKFQTVLEDESIAELSFNGGVISLSSDCNSSNDLIDVGPLDYRLGRSLTNDNLGHNISLSEPIFMNDKACEENYSLCGRPNEWEIESFCGDSIDTDEDMSSISEWINNDEDFWKC